MKKVFFIFAEILSACVMATNNIANKNTLIPMLRLVAIIIAGVTAFAFAVQLAIISDKSKEAAQNWLQNSLRTSSEVNAFRFALAGGGKHPSRAENCSALSEKQLYVDIEFSCLVHKDEKRMLMTRIPFTIKKNCKGRYYFDEMSAVRTKDFKEVRFYNYEIHNYPIMCLFYPIDSLNADVCIINHISTDSSFRSLPNKFGLVESKIALNMTQIEDTFNIDANLVKEKRTGKPSLKISRKGISGIFEKKHDFKDLIINYEVRLNQKYVHRPSYNLTTILM